MAEGLNIDVCICTFRRPDVVETLRSISRLILKSDWIKHLLRSDTKEAHGVKYHSIAASARQPAVRMVI